MLKSVLSSLALGSAISESSAHVSDHDAFRTHSRGLPEPDAQLDMTKQMRSMMDMLAPEEYKGMVIEFSNTLPSALAAAGSAEEAKTSDRQLRYRERNPTYKPSPDDPGYLSIAFYYEPYGSNSDPSDMCPSTLKAQFEWGFLSGSCFVARDAPGSPIVGSWKVGVVKASSGRNHVHVESYTSADCTGEARRSDNHFSRLHFIDGQKYPLSSDHRSRSYLQEYYNAVNGKACYVMESHPLNWGNMPHSCHITNGWLDAYYANDCASEPPLRYNIWWGGSSFGECQYGDSSYSYMNTCNDQGAYSWTNYYNPDGPSYCDPQYMTDHSDNPPPECNSYQGYSWPYQEGWNVTGHQYYSPWLQIHYGTSPEGAYTEASIGRYKYSCFHHPPCN